MFTVFLPLFSGITLRDQSFFFRQMAVMVVSGISFANALSLAAQQTSNQTLRQIVYTMAHDIENGRSFSQTAARFPQLFDETTIAMIMSGEASGQMQTILSDIADHYEREVTFAGRIRTALLYPCLVVITMIVVGVVMTTVVIPRLVESFQSSGVVLPWTTQWLISVSQSLLTYWYAWIVGLIVAIWLGFQFFHAPQGKDFLSWSGSRIPLVKDVLYGGYLVRFTAMLSMLMRSGVPITESLRIVSLSLHNPMWARSLQSIHQEVDRGVPLSAAMARHEVFPKPLVQMVSVGEQTGKVDSVLVTMTDFYEEQTNTAIKGLTSLVEPLALLIVAVGVGFVAVSVILPVYRLAELF